MSKSGLWHKRACHVCYDTVSPSRKMVVGVLQMFPSGKGVYKAPLHRLLSAKAETPTQT